MGYVADYEEDIFISYATIDNDRFPGEDAPWVTQLHEDLLARVKGRLGDDSVRLWRDPEIRNNDDFDKLIKDRLSKTAALLSVLSPSFLARKWTLLELETFVKQAHRSSGLLVKSDKSRIFKVEKIEIPRDKLPAAMQGTKSYKFFKQDAEQPSIKREFRPQLKGDRLSYFRELDNLAIDIANLLRAMMEPAPDPEGLVVYVAETTSDLDEQLWSVRRELSDWGYVVLPDGDLTHRADVYLDEVREHLKRSVLSIHLVGSKYGLIPEGENRSVVRIQHDLALERNADPGFVRFVWMPLDLEPVEESQRDFIEYLRTDADAQKGAEIMETKLDDLKTAVHDKLAALKRLRHDAASAQVGSGEDRLASVNTAANAATAGAALRSEEAPTIYVICDKLDLTTKPLADLRNFLLDQGCEPVLPTENGLTDASLARHLGNLKICDAFLIFYGKGSPEWFDDKLSDYRQYLRGRERRVLAKAIYIPSSDTEHKRQLRTNEAMVLRGHAEFTGTDIAPFLQLLRPVQQSVP